MKNYLNPQTFINAILITIITVGGGILVTRLTGPLPISVTQTLTQKETTFNTTGDSEMSVIPDEAQIRLGIEAYEQTVAAAQSSANQIINDITSAVKKLGINEKMIQTQNYSVNPDYDYNEGEDRIVGYRVSTQILVKINDFEKLNQIIDTATSLGANRVGGINFMISEGKQEELKKEAREEAINKAQANAKELAKLAGIKLGKVVNVTESNGGNYPQPMYARSDTMMLKESGAPTQVEPGSETYRYSVTLSYETL